MASPLPQAAREEKCAGMSRKRRPDAGRPTGARRRWAKSGYAAKEGQQRNALHVRIEGVASAACLIISPRDIYYEVEYFMEGRAERGLFPLRHDERRKQRVPRERGHPPHDFVGHVCDGTDLSLVSLSSLSLSLRQSSWLRLRCALSASRRARCAYDASYEHGEPPHGGRAWWQRAGSSRRGGHTRAAGLTCT